MAEQQIPTKSIVEGAFLAAITAVLFIISIYVPLLGTIVSFLCPLPIIILCLRHSLKFALIATIVSGVLVSLLAGPFQGFMVLLGFGILGFTMGFGIKKELPFTEIIIISSIASFSSKILMLIFGFWFLDINPLMFDVEQIDKIIAQSLSFYSNMGLTIEQLTSLKETLSQTLIIIRTALPAMLILSSIFDTFLNYYVARLVLKKFGYKLIGFKSFSHWRASKSFFWSYCIGAVLMFLGTKYNIFQLNKIGINIQVFFTVVFLICGLSLSAFLMEKYKVTKFLKWIIYILICFLPFLSQIATWAGMLDVWINFRKLIIAKKE
ncbi:MAG: YybS family protein [Candidatus Caldatribacteriota bacterium]|nr:YybS family protein [Candidatus Caldatribacteriota bacterium]